MCRSIIINDVNNILRDCTVTANTGNILMFDQKVLKLENNFLSTV